MARPHYSLAILLVLAGCSQPWKTDPNVSHAGVPVSGSVLARNIAGLMADLDERIAKGAVKASEKDALVADYLDRELAGIDPKRIRDDECWQFGDAYRLKGDWKTAKGLYERAVSSAKNEDRSVNDRLRLARAMAHFGENEAAIQTVRSTFTANPSNKAPILMAVLYEIVPEAKGDGKEFARLLVDAVAQHQKTIVDPETPEGAAFLETRSVHVRAALLLAASLYAKAGDQETARSVVERAERLSGEVARI